MLLEEVTSKDSPAIVGNRVKSARMLSGHSRKSFSMVSGMSMATLRAWEEPLPDRSGLTYKGAARLVIALGKMGIYCTEIWLLSGNAPGPRVVQLPHSTLDDSIEVTWGGEESILKDIESFKKNNRDPIVAIVTDGSMLPRFSYGDYVGGIKVYGNNIENIVGTDCIVEAKGKTYIRRISSFVGSKYTLIALNQEPSVTDAVIIGATLISAAEIVWHRWRNKRQDITV